MPRRQKLHHFIYKTTCLVTGKFYVGMHSTDDLNDGYLGSGKRLGYSRKKHGDENHRKEILEHLPSREALKLREKEIVNEELLADSRCLNLKVGGEGGWERVNSFGQNISGFSRDDRYSQAMSAAKKGKPLSDRGRLSLVENHWSKDTERFRAHASKMGSYAKTTKHRQKIAASISNHPTLYATVQCPNCGKQGARNAMSRWHFDKCKQVSRSSIGKFQIV